jgi:Protein of unknown function (DUF3710)
MFRKRGPRHVRSTDAPPSDALAQSMAGEAEPPAPERGPYDVRQAPADVPRLDFGSLQIPAVEGVEVRVQANPDGAVEVIVLVEGESALQLGVFAAPRSEGIWDEVRDEIAAAMAADGVQPARIGGPYGVELTARVQTPDGPADVRFVGVDGPRWMLRALYQGPAAADPGYAGMLAQCLEGVVVVRDEEARPPREPLPLRLPKEMAEQAHEQARQQAEAEAEARHRREPGPATNGRGPRA